MHRLLDTGLAERILPFDSFPAQPTRTSRRASIPPDAG